MAAPHPSATPAIAALLANGWRLAHGPLLTGAAFVVVCSPAGTWGRGVVAAGRDAAAYDAAYLRAALDAAHREGHAPPWLLALAGLPHLPPAAPWATFDLDERLLSLEKRCIAAGLDEERVTHLVRQLAAEFEV